MDKGEKGWVMRSLSDQEPKVQSHKMAEFLAGMSPCTLLPGALQTQLMDRGMLPSALPHAASVPRRPGVASPGQRLILTAATRLGFQL